LAALGRIEGCGGVTEFLARVLYRLSAKIMNLRGRTAFWEKYHVTRREPLYLLFQSGTKKHCLSVFIGPIRIIRVPLIAIIKPN
jgi:hypothetical protein